MRSRGGLLFGKRVADTQAMSAKRPNSGYQTDPCHRPKAGTEAVTQGATILDPVRFFAICRKSC